MSCEAAAESAAPAVEIEEMLGRKPREANKSTEVAVRLLAAFVTLITLPPFSRGNPLWTSRRVSYRRVSQISLTRVLSRLMRCSPQPKKPENPGVSPSAEANRIGVQARRLGVFLLCGALFAACTANGVSDQAKSGGENPEASSPGSKRESLTVSVPSSAASAVTRIADGFERSNRGMKVLINAGPSNALASQVSSGAEVDVLLSADAATLSGLIAEKKISSPRIFALNQMALVVSLRAAGIKRLSDLTNASVVALCAESAPCGGYAKRVLARAGVTIKASQITRGMDAASTLGAVRFGDADAAIVYETDARAAGKSVLTRQIPNRFNEVAKYPAVVVLASKHMKEAKAFVRYLKTPFAKRVLMSGGFSTP